jgi:nucleoside-diphosphate-sugar epimerase
MRVLVLGGTGAMGNHLVKLLSDKGIETVVTTRSNRKAEEKIKYVQGNALEIEFLKTILDDKWDAIIDFMVYSTKGFKERVNLLLASTSQYVFLSSARVYAETTLPIKETSPRLLDVTDDAEYLSTDEYALTKARQEDVLINSGLSNWTIIRPYITYSEDRLQLGVLEKEDWLYRALHGRTIIFSEDINFRKTTLTYGQDVAKGILAVIGNSSTVGEKFHITVDSAIRWDDVLNIYLDVLEKTIGKRPKVVLEDLEHFVKSHPASYQINYDRLYNREFDNSKINTYIETKHFVNTRVGLKNSLEKFLEKPDFKNINWRTEALKDKASNEITPIFEIKSVIEILKYLVYRFIKK